jgi:Predicted membrane protein
MKKKIMLFLLLLIMPFSIGAAGIERFYMNAKVNINGDMEVEEVFIMNGSYNGFERILKYKNDYAPAFNSEAEDFGGSSIHNGTEIVLSEVKALEISQVKAVNNQEIDELFSSFGNMDTFIKVNSANSGDYGKYTLSTSSSGINVKIFNPSTSKAFYLKYIVKGVGIKHNDVAEIGYNIFSNEMRESIADFQMLITLPGNSDELRVWAHGPLTGEVDKVNNNGIFVKIRNLNENTAIDTRFVYDSNLIETDKTTGVDALPRIIKYEERMAEEANQKREEAKRLVEAEEKRKDFFGLLSSIALMGWLVGVGVMTYNVYKKHDKEYDSTMKTKYFRDIPTDYSPEIVGYLMKKKIDTNDLSANILYMINAGLIKYEKKDKKDYQLTNNSIGKSLSKIEEKVINLIFKNGDTITLKEFKKYAKNSYSSFLTRYDSWSTTATKNGEEQDFFENKEGVKAKSALISFVGVVLAFFSFKYNVFIPFNIFCIIVGIATFIYFLSFEKRTPKGNEEYVKWNGLKNFINDFGNFKDRELPHIELWDKYMVYAVSFRLADKLVKQMEIKMQNMNMSQDMSMNYRYSYYTDLMIFNRIMNTSVTQARSSAMSAKAAAESRSSSGGGGGGGFSSGGGSFGGGGGGGRF